MKNSHLSRGMKVLALTLLLLPGVPSIASAETSDVRVLVDVSGSMKKNDPQNLRQPALRLLIGLLPQGAKSGAWNFSQGVSASIPHGDVSDAWKKRAEKGVEKIHSRGLFTNIEQALERSTRDWGPASTDSRRNLILLTDGMVDVSKNAEASEQSRQRILERWAPKLAKKGINVHTIALSERADHELLMRLSQVTGGWYEQAKTAEDLQRVFLHMFEKAAPADTLPIEGNRFQVDDSIDQMTVLAFRKLGAEPSQLAMPGGEIITFDALRDDVRWSSDAGYDLITIDNPAVGEWTIIGDVDPDNRVMIVTDLKLMVSELPNNVQPGETLIQTAYLMEGDKKITKPMFLDLVNASMSQESEQGQIWERDVFDDGSEPDEKAQDGVYSFKVPDTTQEGRHEVELVFRSETFTRSVRQTFQIQLPFNMRIEAGMDMGEHQLTVVADAELLDTSTIKAMVEVTDPNGVVETYPMTSAAFGDQLLTLEGITLPGEYAIQVSVDAVNVKGEAIQARLPVELIQVDLPAGASTELASTSSIGSADATDSTTTEEMAVDAEESSTAEPDWMMIAAAAGGGALLLGLLGFWFMKRKKKSDDGDQLLLDEEELEEEIPEPPPTAPTIDLAEEEDEDDDDELVTLIEGIDDNNSREVKINVEEDETPIPSPVDTPPEPEMPSVAIEEEEKPVLGAFDISAEEDDDVEVMPEVKADLSPEEPDDALLKAMETPLPETAELSDDADLEDGVDDELDDASIDEILNSVMDNGDKPS